MRSTKIRWAAAVLSCLTGGAIAMAPAGAAASPAGHHTPSAETASSKGHHAHGFYVVNRAGKVQKVETFGTPSALVRDSNGAEHVVTTQPSKSDPSMGHLVYLTRDSDKGTWKSRTVPGSRNLAGGVQVEAHLSNGGHRVFAVLYECDGVFAADTPITSGRLPVPTKIASADTCLSPPASTDNPPMAHSGNYAGRTIAVMMNDPAQLNAEALFTGTPGSSTPFTPGTAIPTTDSFVPEQVAIDPLYGFTVVVGEGSDGTNEGIYAVTQERYSDHWTGPVQIATLNSPTTDYSIDSVQTYNHHAYVGLEKPGKHLNHSLYLARSQPSGQWLGAVPLPHGTGNDHDLRLVVNTNTRHLHAVWTRIIPGHKTSKKSGLMHEAQNDQGWLKPYYMTHSYRDVATQITLTASRHPIVGFNQQ